MCIDSSYQAIMSWTTSAHPVLQAWLWPRPPSPYWPVHFWGRGAGCPPPSPGSRPQRGPCALAALQLCPLRSPWRHPATWPPGRGWHHSGAGGRLSLQQAAQAGWGSSLWRSWKSAGTGCARNSGGRKYAALRTAYGRTPRNGRRSPRSVCKRGPRLDAWDVH